METYTLLEDENKNYYKKKKEASQLPLFLVIRLGFEPKTPTLKV